MKSWFEPTAIASTDGPDAGFVPTSLLTDAFEATSSSERAASVEMIDAEEVESRVSEAYARGVADTRTERERDDELALRVLAALDGVSTQLEGLCEEQAAVTSRAAIELALVVAEQIVRREISADADGLAARVAEAIEGLTGPRTIALSLAQQDLLFLEQRAESQLAQLLDAREVEVRADPTLQSGEFQLESGGAHIDARVDGLVARFREELGEPASGGETG